MSLRFKYDAAKDKGNQEIPEEPLDDKIDVLSYKSVGNTCNLCFVQTDGKRTFLNYSYLISGDYDPTDSSITLLYTTHNVMIRGSNLEDLYEELIHQVARVITCTDKRYEDSEDEKALTIAEISISKHNN